MIVDTDSSDIYFQEASEIHEMILESVMDITEAERELLNVQLQYESTLDILDCAIDAIITDEDAREIQYEEAEADKASLWNRILDKLRSFIESIKKTWKKFMEFLQQQAYRIDYYWYKDRLNKISAGIQNLPAGTRINLTHYVINDPVASIQNDIKDCQSVLQNMYNEAGKFITDVINDKNQSFMDKLRGGNVNRSDALDVFQANARDLATLCGLKNFDLTELSTGMIREAVFNKYYGSEIPSKQNSDPKSVVSDLSHTTILTVETVNSVKKMCDLISTGSSKSEVNLKRLDHFTRNNMQSSLTKALQKDANSKANVCITSLRSTLSLCNSIGLAFWSVFLHIRIDVKRCVNLYVKL